jgi:hypothetical protein
MLRTILFISGVLFTSVSIAAADPADDIQAAVTKVAQSDNYSWHTAIDGHSVFTPGPYGPGEALPAHTMPNERWSQTFDGKTNRDGLSLVTVSESGQSFDAVIVGQKAIIKVDNEWKTPDEIQPGGGPMAAFPLRMTIPIQFVVQWAKNFQSPAGLLLSELKNIQNIKSADGGYTADLPPEPNTHDTSRTIQVWIKDGSLTRFQIQTAGNLAEQSWDNTDTTDLSGVGTTKVELPADAKAKLEPMQE